MQFSILALLGSAALAAAGNTITFKSLDEVDRTVYFVASAGLAAIEPVKVPGNSTQKVDMPESWIGNWYSVSEGEENTTGMLGEVSFNGWNGLTYFDVSAIVNPNDHSGVKKMYPASGRTPVSGCDCFPCDEAYYLADDVQTKVTSETDLVTTLGNNNCVGSSKRDEARHEQTESVKRAFVLGKF